MNDVAAGKCVPFEPKSRSVDLHVKALPIFEVFLSSFHDTLITSIVTSLEFLQNSIDIMAIFGSKNTDEENVTNGDHSGEANERTSLLHEQRDVPPARGDGYLDPDDPAVSGLHSIEFQNRY
jgi:hypothetical protein